MLTSDFAKSVTVRARAAFVLTVAERVVTSISPSQGAALAEAAINAGWEWQNSGNISGQLLYDFLEDENDEGLFFVEIEADEEEQTAWICVTNAIAYVARCAYETDGDRVMASPLWQVTEETLSYVAEYAVKCNAVEARWIGLLTDYLFEVGATNDPTNLGDPFDREACHSVVK